VKRLLLLCFCLVTSFSLNGQTGNIVYGGQPPPSGRLTIRNVRFENADRVPKQERQELVARIRRNGGSPDRVLTSAQEFIREACQDEGYFKSEVNAAVEQVAGNADDARQFDVVVKVVNYGKRYRLQEIHFINAKAFSEEELVKLIAVQPGEVFSRARIAKGLEALQQYYQAAGYVNITYIPNTEFDASNATARLDIDVDEGNVLR
jgi:outer membrane protein assembly factor BamA